VISVTWSLMLHSTRSIPLASLAVAPYSLDWTPRLSGSYRIVATAIDKAGNRAAAPESLVDVR
jgi:hypothetical protein